MSTEQTPAGDLPTVIPTTSTPALIRDLGLAAPESPAEVKLELSGEFSGAIIVVTLALDAENVWPDDWFEAPFADAATVPPGWEPHPDGRTLSRWPVVASTVESPGAMVAPPFRLVLRGAPMRSSDWLGTAPIRGCEAVWASEAVMDDFIARFVDLKEIRVRDLSAVARLAPATQAALTTIVHETRPGEEGVAFRVHRLWHVRRKNPSPIGALVGAHRVKRLDVRVSDPDDIARIVVHHPNLQTLRLADGPRYGYDIPGITDEGMDLLSTLEHLVDLDLDDAEISDVGWRALARLPLERLAVWSGMYSPEEPIPLSAFAATGTLRTLSVQLPINDEIAHLRGLRRLDTPSAYISDSAWAAMQRLPHLNDLTVGNGGWDRSQIELLMERVSALPHLKRLTLLSQRVSDEYLDAFAPLQKMRSLQRLDIRTTNLTADGLVSLRSLLVGVAVVHDWLDNRAPDDHSYPSAPFAVASDGRTQARNLNPIELVFGADWGANVSIVELANPKSGCWPDDWADVGEDLRWDGSLPYPLSEEGTGIPFGTMRVRSTEGSMTVVPPFRLIIDPYGSQADELLGPDFLSGQMAGCDGVVAYTTLPAAVLARLVDLAELHDDGCADLKGAPASVLAGLKRYIQIGDAEPRRAADLSGAIDLEVLDLVSDDDDDVACIVANHRNLTSLTIRRHGDSPPGTKFEPTCHSLTDETVALLRYLPRLRHLRLNNSEISATGLDTIAPLALETLEVSRSWWLEPVDASFDALAGPKSLRRLKLNGFVVDERVGALRSVEHLGVSAELVTEEGWRSMGTMPRLARLDAPGRYRLPIYRQLVATMSGIGELPHLRHLSLAPTPRLAFEELLRYEDFLGHLASFDLGYCDLDWHSLSNLEQELRGVTLFERSSPELDEEYQRALWALGIDAVPT